MRRPLSVLFALAICLITSCAETPRMNTAMNPAIERGVEHVWVPQTEQAQILGAESAYSKCIETIVSQCVAAIESACNSKSTIRFMQNSGKLASKEEIDFLCSLDKKYKAFRCPISQQIYLQKRDQIAIDSCMTSSGFKLEKETSYEFNLNLNAIR